MVADFYETTNTTVWRITSFTGPYRHLGQKLSEAELRELELVRNVRGGVSVKKVRAIKQYHRNGMSIPDCAAAVGIHYQTAYNILNGISRKDVE